MNGTIFRGSDFAEMPQEFINESNDRVSFRFQQSEYENIKLLSRLMDVTPSRATALLVNYAIRHHDVINTLFESYNRRHSPNDDVIDNIKRFTKYIKKDNPYVESRWGDAIMRVIGLSDSKVKVPILSTAKDTASYKWDLEENAIPTEFNFKCGQGWSVPVGAVSKNKVIYHDFERIPHMVLGGATRYGKSNFINSMITSLLQSEPDHLNLFLIDLKGGVELCDYENMNQTVSIAYEPEDALETLKDAYNKMRELQAAIRRAGKKNVVEAGIKERYFIIIDEVGELNPSEAITKEEKAMKLECQTLMSQIARLGAGLGFRLVLATQYGTGDIVPRQVKQNADAKLCFRVQSAVASRVVLDSNGAEDLPEIVGRAIYQTADKREILQTPLITSEITRKTISRYRVRK